MKIREVGQKAENLIEQGERAKQQQAYYQRAAASARSQLMAAYAMLEAASETDEDGNARGDVGAAKAQIYAAQAQLASAERGLSESRRMLESINIAKQETIREVDRYTEGEQRNLSLLEQLQKKRFGGNANAFIADLVARMNSGEAAKDRLLQSMGQSPSGKRFSGSSAVSAPGAVGGSVAFSGGVATEQQNVAAEKSSFLDRLRFSRKEASIRRKTTSLDFSGLKIECNGLAGDRYIVKGNNYDRFCNVLRDINDYTQVKSQYGNSTILVDARNIEGIKLNENEAHDPHLFWNRNQEYAVESSEYFYEVASHLPEVQRRLDLGEPVDSIRNDPLLQTCYDYYFADPIQVYEVDDYFVFGDAGRHRCMAAQRDGYKIPVKVIAKFDSKESLELQRMGVNTVHLSGCTSDNRKAVVTSIKQVFGDHPELIGQLSEVKCRPIHSEKGKTYAHYGPMQFGDRFGGSLIINSDAFSDPKLRDELTKLSKQGLFVPDASPESIIAHELCGHGSHLELCALACHVQNGSTPDRNSYNQVIRQYISNAHADVIVERACAELGIEFDSWDFADALSRYGGSDYGEAIAEAAAEVKFSKKPRPLASAIYRHFLNYRDELRGGVKQ